MKKCPHCSTVLSDDKQKCDACGLSVADEFAPTIQKSPDEDHTPTKIQETEDPIHTTASDGGRFVAGTVLAKRYRIIGLLGKGGMGEVYKAEDLELDQTVALKFLPESFAKDKSALARFRGEVRNARKVSHANVCRVFDIGEMDGSYYLSMEYVDGDDLSMLLKRIGRLPSDKAVEISRQICLGLHAIHDNGILHRDLKPANIIIDSRGKARITDFGIAGVEQEIQGKKEIIGTPAYMSPEQITGKEVTAKSDIYSLGLLLYEIFTGKQAIKGESFNELIEIHQSQTPTNPSTFVENIDPLVEKIINRCLEKEPSDRPKSALQVALSLPGGNPLEAAIAAGETPSPEMVAAAPKKGVLRLPVALALLAAFIGLFALSMYLASEYQTHAFTPLEKSPEVLQERAKTVLNNSGYTDVSNDGDYGFGYDINYLAYAYKTKDFSLYNFEKLRSGQPFVVYFWYRQSRKRLLPISIAPGITTESDPPLTEPGTEYVKLDALGRLVEMVAAPPQIRPQKTNGEANWEVLFKEAGLDIEKFKKTEPELTPPINSDEQAAWQGTLADYEDIPIRIEAAAFNGKPVYFRIITPWDEDSIKEGLYGANAFQISAIIGFVFNFLAIFGAIILSYFNLRAGRGDLKGAAKVSIFYFIARIIHRLISYDYDSILNDWQVIFFIICGQTVVLFLLYVAIEPFVRRWWTEVLISWNRLMAGDFTNPLIGRDVLVGGLLGFVLVLSQYFGGFLRDFIVSRSLTIIAVSTSTLEGTRENIAQILLIFTDSIVVALLVLMLFVIFHLVVKRKWLATLFVGFFIVGLLGIGFFPSRGWSYLIFLLVIYVPLVFLFIRFGLLTIITGLIFMRLMSIAITFDTSRFYFSNTIIVAVIGLAIALYAFYISIGDQEIFEGKILKE